MEFKYMQHLSIKKQQKTPCIILILQKPNGVKKYSIYMQSQYNALMGIDELPSIVYAIALWSRI